MSNFARSHASGSTRSIVLATAFFLLMTLALGGMMFYVISTMARSANEIDDDRAVRAAFAAVSAFQSRLGGTVKDNAVWDDAYAAMNSASIVASGWAYENWGKVTTNYTLYDGAVAVGPDGQVISAYVKGASFVPKEYFGDGFERQLRIASVPQSEPNFGFIRTISGVVLLASQAIQPFDTAQHASKPSVLTFFKILTPQVVDELARHNDLDGLRLQPSPEPGLLSVPIEDIDNTAGAYLVWPSQIPGSAIFKSVVPCLIAAVGILGLFLTAVLFAGSYEARRLRRMAETARHDATHDSLSGLFNRPGLLAVLEQLRATNFPITLYLIDLDGFKTVNDFWGHPIGDELIAMVADELRICHPDLVASARLGGDEFALVSRGSVPGTSVEDAIFNLFKQPFKIGGRTLEVGASVGVAVSTGDIQPLELLRRSDIALYHAKANSKGHSVNYDAEMDHENKRVVELEGRLRQAIAEGGIEPVFQPLISASSGKVVGLEALARWQSVGGWISPEIFIPLAERSGLIDALGVHMLRMSLHYANRWSELALSVNVSPIQLCNPDFPNQVVATLKEHSFEPTRLTLEITESVLMTNPDQARRSIDQLKRVGIKFALDDFGCGYASIGALRQFGFDRVKIDRSLVAGVEGEAKGVDVLRATVALAMALNIAVTAEGIENDRQADILRNSGCDQLQGYLIGRPMTPDEISDLVETLPAGALRDAREA
ncbi:bifunctional diguanylate cyclase/phosphodiesterase [Rhizobium leguminosarum]